MSRYKERIAAFPEALYGEYPSLAEFFVFFKRKACVNFQILIRNNMRSWASKEYNRRVPGIYK